MKDQKKTPLSPEEIEQRIAAAQERKRERARLRAENKENEKAAQRMAENKRRIQKNEESENEEETFVSLLDPFTGFEQKYFLCCPEKVLKEYMECSSFEECMEKFVKCVVWMGTKRQDTAFILIPRDQVREFEHNYCEMWKKVKKILLDIIFAHPATAQNILSQGFSRKNAIIHYNWGWNL